MGSSGSAAELDADCSVSSDKERLPRNRVGRSGRTRAGPKLLCSVPPADERPVSTELIVGHTRTRYWQSNLSDVSVKLLGCNPTKTRCYY